MIRSKTIEFSYVDSKLELSPIKTCEIIEDSVTGFLHENNVDNSIIKTEYDALMVVYKHRIHFDRIPKLGETIEISTEFSKIRNASFIIDTEAKGFFKCSSLLCLMNNTTRFPESLKNINFAGSAATNTPLDYTKIQSEKFKYAYSQMVLSTDIDYSNHANNKSYIKYIFNALTNDKLNSMKLVDVEIHYLKEVLEGELLDIYMHEDNNEILFEIKRKDEAVTLGKIVYC